MTRFITDQDGAVTVEKMVVVAGVVGLVIAVFTAVSQNTEGLVIRATTELACVQCEDTSFDDPPEGAQKIEGGYLYYGDLDGWRSIDRRGNTDTSRLEIIEVGWRDYRTMTGTGFGVDLESCTGCQGLTKDLANLEAGREYSVSFNLADPAARGPNPVEVFFGGESVGVVQASNANSQLFQMKFTAGSGDGSDNLTFKSKGTHDGYGEIGRAHV